MFQAILVSMILINCCAQNDKHLELSFGPHYSSYHLYWNDEAARNQWSLGGEVTVHNIIPNIGPKLRGSKIEYTISSDYTYVSEYIPLTLCTSFNIIPFLKLRWLRLSLETGFGMYFWKALPMEMIAGEDKKGRDIGFVGGFTLQVKPFKFIALEYVTRYNYIASADIYKYGFEDKDEKLWENGIGLKIIIP